MTTQKNLLGTGTSPLAAQAAVGILNSAVAAAGNSQGTATVLSTDLNVVTSATATTAYGVILPVSQPGDWITVANHSGTAITVYPPVGGAIAAGTTNAGFSVNSTKTAQFQCISANGLNFAASVSA